MPRIEEMIDRTILNIIAQRNPVTVNPSTRLLARRTNNPLMMRPRIPSVKILIGRVRSFTIGLTNVLITPSTAATRIAVRKLSSWTLGNMYAAIATARAFISIRTIRAMLSW